MNKILTDVFNQLKFDGKVKTKADFAEKLGNNRTYVSELFGSETIPDKIKKAITTKFGVSPTFLESGMGDMYGPEQPTRAFKNKHDNSRLADVYSYLLDKRAVTSKKDFAEQLNLDYSYLSQMFGGFTPITYAAAVKIETVFYVNRAYLLNESDTLEAPPQASDYREKYIQILEANREEAKAREEKMFHLLTGYVSKGTFQVFAAKVDALQEFVVEKVAKFGKTSLEEVSAGLGIKQAEVWKDYEKGTRTYESSSSRGK